MNATTFYTFVNCPVGRLVVRGDGQFVTGLYLPHHKGWHGPDLAWQQSDAPFNAVKKQLAEFFAGERQQFAIPIRLEGTEFQNRVWQELQRIPFGATITYAQLARRVGRPTASRAVGHANGCNPISIIVPCHRVIGSKGDLTGYAGGVDKKRWLLDWERAALKKGREATSDGLSA